MIFSVFLFVRHLLEGTKEISISKLVFFVWDSIYTYSYTYTPVHIVSRVSFYSVSGKYERRLPASNTVPKRRSVLKTGTPVYRPDKISCAFEVTLLDPFS